ncbi:hypothetical protein ACFL6X_02825 [Candidatus Latescibacterota bacterium]
MRVLIEVAGDACELQRHAAGELQGYLRQLFGVEAEMPTVGRGVPQGATRFVVGLASAAHVRAVCPQLPELSDQGHLVRRVDERTMVLVGGSATAVAWAVYELGEQYGIRYLLHDDVVPVDAGVFHLPDVDVVCEPLLRLRSWRQMNDLPTGPALWSLGQQEAFIRQVFKLKYNGIYLCLWPQHPFIDYQVKGIRRQTATMLFGQRIPIDGDNIGRELLPDLPYLDNPELAGAETYEEKLAAGRRLIEGILERARFYQMHTSIQVQPLEFPREFAPLLQQPTGGIQLGGLTCAEQGDLSQADHVALVETKLNAYLEQWGEVDELYLSLPEHPHADAQFRACWEELDGRHGLESVAPLEELLAVAQRNYLIPGGLERATREFKSSISMLHFFDGLLGRGELLSRAADRGVGIGLTLGGSSEPLFPILERVLWPGGAVATSLGYTASRAVRVMECMERLDATHVPASLVLTLQDDNVGSLPQVATGSLHLLAENMKRLGWRGFFTRHWPVGDLDPPAAYLARTSWGPVTPSEAYGDHFTHVYGPRAAPELGQVMGLLEEVTVILDLDFLSLFFPVLGIMLRHLEAGAPMAEGLFHVRATYEQANRMLTRAASAVETEAGHRELAYWQARLTFAIEALREKEEVHEGGVCVQAARATDDDHERARLMAAARARYQRGVEAGEAALQATASRVRDDSDRSSLAAYYHFFVREVRGKADQVLAGDEGVHVQTEPM